ncbi:MAG: hypothetical protein U9O98_07120, partial [Asgard group archaeon]|nr:hypothetical protein [Asgard group archaeon]
YKKHFTKILAVVSEEFWWNDYLLEYFLYTRANEYYTKAKDLLEDNPLDPSLLMSINYEISLCETNAKIALGKFYLELAVNTLLEDKHAKAYEYFIFSQKHFSEAHEFLETSNYNTKQNKILQSVIEQNSQYSQSFAKLLAISCSIIEFTTEKLSAKKLKARIKSLHALIEAPLESFDYINQAEFINTVGFIIENLTLLSKHEKLTQEDIKTEMEKGFKRMGRIFEGRIDSISKNFLALPWEEDKKDRQVKYNFCETETAKLQDILIAILLMPSYVSNRKGLIAKTRSLLEVIQSEFYHLKGLEESNNTKALCLFVKYYLKAKEAFDNLSLGKIKGPLEEFVNTAFIQSFVKSHLKEASILQNGNQYFFARYLLRILPDILDMSEITKAPKEIAELLIEYHGSLFDSLITIWERLTQHYQAILEHKQTYDAPDFIVNWDYIEKKKHHTKGALLFYKSCQAFVQAQEYAKLKNRVKAEKLFRQADKNATESANIFNSVIDSLKGEVKKLPQDLYSFASYCKTQSQKVSSGKPIDKIPIREFVVLIGIISGSL